jgi:hypothetical protein
MDNGDRQMTVYVVDFGDTYDRELVGVTVDLAQARQLAADYLNRYQFTRKAFDEGTEWFQVRSTTLGQIRDGSSELLEGIPVD